MQDLTDEKKQTLLEKLIKEEERVVKQLKSIAVEDKSEGGGFRSAMKDGEDMGRREEDAAQDVANMEVKFSQEGLLEKRLRDIKLAKERLQIGDESFGLCEVCGKEINAKRLSYDPTLAACVSCAEDK